MLLHSVVQLAHKLTCFTKLISTTITKDLYHNLVFSYDLYISEMPFKSKVHEKLDDCGPNGLLRRRFVATHWNKQRTENSNVFY
jgi:hypothetical protein